MAKIQDARDERVAAHNAELASETARFNIFNGLITSLGPALARVVQGMGEAAAENVSRGAQQQAQQQTQNQQAQQTRQARQPVPPTPQTDQEGVEVVPPEQVIHDQGPVVEGKSLKNKLNHRPNHSLNLSLNR